jgi:hypothetical protein
VVLYRLDSQKVLRDFNYWTSIGFFSTNLQNPSENAVLRAVTLLKTSWGRPDFWMKFSYKMKVLAVVVALRPLAAIDTPSLTSEKFGVQPLKILFPLILRC